MVFCMFLNDSKVDKCKSIKLQFKKLTKYGKNHLLVIFFLHIKLIRIDKFIAHINMQ